ncbi:ABC transporter permease [Bacteroidota bacterium]
MELKNSQISYIVKDLHKKGLVYEPLEEEIIDHFCCIIEDYMKSGLAFGDAYKKALLSFGRSEEIINTQQQTITYSNKNTKVMIRNYLKIASRSLFKHKFYSFINIFGLAAGVAICMVIMLFVFDELSYDRHFKDADRIYRFNSDVKFGGNDMKLAVMPAPLADAMVNDYPEVEASTRLRSWGSFLVRKGEETIKEYNVIWADSTFFNVFSVPVIKGNAKTALVEPNSIAISESLAKKYFGNEEALGEMLTLDNQMEVKITAVYKDMPKNSHFHFDLLIAMVGLDESKNGFWLSHNFHTYIKLREGANPATLTDKFPAMLEKYAGPQIKQFMGITLEEFQASENNVEYSLMPLTDIHLHSNRTPAIEPGGEIKYIYIFSAVAIFILLLACVNFMNLSTAKSADRAKEVGIRKVMGSYKIHLIRQFLTESILLSLLAVLLAIAIAGFILPLFNNLSGKELSLPLNSLPFWIAIAISILALGLLAGIYPAFFLSSFKPVTVLKGKLSSKIGNNSLRNVLVVFQFSISILLIIGTAAVYNQLSYIQNKKLGFSKDQVIIIHDAYSMDDQLESFRTEILRDPRIISGSLTGFLPVQSSRNNSAFWPKGKRGIENSVSMQNWRVDNYYTATMGMNIIDGRTFSQDFPSDSLAMILNEEALKLFGFEDPIGQEIQSSRRISSTGEEQIVKYHVIGIVENFHFESLKNKVGALSLIHGNDKGMASFRFQAENTSEVISVLEDKWKEMAPLQPFQYSFMDDEFAKMYEAEQRIGKIFISFSVLAIIIACLGLFALAAYTAEQRTKEIGVRKVMGASVRSVVILLSRDFGKLVIISFIIAVPVAWYGISQWLQSFEYKSLPEWWVYALSGILALVIAWLTIGYQAIRTATVNPVQSLRDE